MKATLVVRSIQLTLIFGTLWFLVGCVKSPAPLLHTTALHTPRPYMPPMSGCFKRAKKRGMTDTQTLEHCLRLAIKSKLN